MRVAPPWQIPKAPPSTMQQVCQDKKQKNGPNERTDHSSKKKKKTQVSDEEIVNLSDAEFKTLVIRILTELVEYGLKIEEKVKAMKSEIK